ncbi:MAG: hypothetical protein J6S75_14130, partial [Thermoguttaceae bacterium]|nr:hypothetical protein [Thermoguttaceae bacterium]
GVGQTFTEVEFSCGNTILGSSWTDENGCFVWTPTGLPVVGGIATGTITAKAVWRPEEGLPVYGTSASVAVTYAPAESSEPLTLSLADATNTAGTQTGTPLITVLGTFHSEAIVRYEYQWKTSEGQWSTAEQSAAAAADEVNEDNEADFEASLRLSGFGALSGSSSAITVRARALVYDTILGTTRPLTDWSTLAFTYVKPTVALQVDDLQLADPIGEGSASRPTLTGTVTGTENLSGLVISVFNGAALVGTTKTDSDGYFSVLPTLTQYGPVTLTVKATFWDSDAREYATETLDTISFNYVAPTTSAAVIDELRLLNDTNLTCTGVDYDGVTAQTILTGRLRDDGDPLERVTVEIDLDGDGTADTSVLTDSQGRFTYTACVASGQYTAGARAVRWDFSQQCAVVGEWKTLTFTYSPDQNSTVPFLAEFGPITGLLNADGTMVTTDPAVAGRVVALCGSADVTIQLDLDADGIVEETLTPDTLGNFCWRPSVTPSGTDTPVTIAVRLGRTDNDITTWGTWSQFQYIYRAPAESILLDWDIRNTAEENVFTISGRILTASGIDSAALQIDCTGDEEIDGIVYANSVGEFLYTGAVDRSEIRVRIVDTLTTGTQRLASSGWTTLTVRDFTQQANASSPQLSLQQNTSEPDTAGFDLRVTGMIGSYSSLTVAFDIDTDGTADFTLYPSASGLISASEIADALAARVSYGGLFFLEARISAPAAQVSDPIYVPVLIADGLNAEELSSAQTILTGFTTAYSGSQSAQTTITQTGSDDSAAGLSIQTTSEPASDTSSPSVTDDWKVLAVSAFPSIEVPTIIGEIPNLSTDITLADDLSRIARQYDMNITEAAKTYSLAYAAMEDQYNAACQYAWNIYNARYQELLARYQSLLEESWADTGEDARLRSEYNQAIDDASARRAAQLAAANQTYTTTSSALYSDYLDDYMSEHGDCSGSCTIECLDHQLAALRTYNAGLIGAAADRDEALVQIEADYLNA